MRLRFGLLVIAALVLAFPVHAWHRDGHMAVARIAWKQLENDKGVREKLTRILKAHVHKSADGDVNHHELYLAADRPTLKKNRVEISEAEWAFAKAAAWADWIRDPRFETNGLTPAQVKAIKEFNRGRWHYINLPHAHPKDAEIYNAKKLDALMQAAFEPEWGPPDYGKGPDEPRHAIAAMKLAMKKLGDPQTDDAEKAVYLCWLMHLIGDIHQPLHASGLLARTESLPATPFQKVQPFVSPAGDMGGNRLAIKMKKDGSAMPLHTYWDGLVFRELKDFASVDAMTQSMLRDKKLQPETFPELANAKEFRDWANESFDLAKNVAYRINGTPDSDFLPALPLPLRSGGQAREQAAKDLQNLDTHVLTPEYQAKATSVAERRIVLAGYRLAMKIKEVIK